MDLADMPAIPAHNLHEQRDKAVLGGPSSSGAQCNAGQEPVNDPNVKFVIFFTKARQRS